MLDALQFSLPLPQFNAHTEYLATFASAKLPHFRFLKSKNRLSSLCCCAILISIPTPIEFRLNSTSGPSLYSTHVMDDLVKAELCSRSVHMFNAVLTLHSVHIHPSPTWGGYLTNSILERCMEFVHYAIISIKPGDMKVTNCGDGEHGVLRIVMGEFPQGLTTYIPVHCLCLLYYCPHQTLPPPLPPPSHFISSSRKCLIVLPRKSL